ncbi:MAG TPA: DUF4340 domain-containing protein [Candidatus Sulfotelmatobacter sp.]|jgi:hypothetical protein|nr:DUF4340 domain-containing protein [Candidatus Sulfotelmatobacter sp.]
MKSNTTPIWFVLAAVLAGFIWFAEKHLQPAAPVNDNLLPGLNTAEVTALDIYPAGEHKITLVRTNQSWVLREPFDYPAQETAVDSLLDALEKVSPVLRLTAADMQSHKNADADFGFDYPRFALDVTAGDQSWHLLVGNRTAPGDGVYVRQVGAAGAFVTDLNWLQFLPHNATNWRETRLIPAGNEVDWIVITNATKVVELRNNPTNHIWYIIRPEPVRRADAGVIATALQQLRGAQATRFVTDDSKADLTAFGLQPADLDLWLGHGTNLTDALHLGKESTENPGQLFAKREGWNSIVAAAKDTLLPWHGSANDFREARLLDFSAPVTGIEVQDTIPWALQLHGSNEWQVAGEKFPVDNASVENLIALLGNLRTTEYVKDVVSAADLQNFGLATNTRAFTVHFADGTTNALIFGGVDTNKNEVFVKRADEDFVYALSFNDVSRLPAGGFQLRESRLWNFPVTNVASITVKQGDKTRQIKRLGNKIWTLAEGSQGVVDTIGLEETANIFGHLAAALWVERNFTPPEKYGLGSTNAVSVTFAMKTGENYTVDFGMEIQSGTTAVAAVTLDGERWAFIFPPALYPLLDAYLKIPPTP